LSADIETENARRLAQAFEPTIIAGNLPYLPQRLSTPDSTRDAGSDGLRFIEILLSYSRMPSVQLATLNMCSMTTPQKALELFSANDLAIDTAYVFKTTFGYRTRLLFEQGVIDESRGHYFHVAADGTPYQVMMNLVMSRGGLRKDGVGSEQIMAMLSHFSRTGEVVKGLGQVRRPLS